MRLPEEPANPKDRSVRQLAAIDEILQVMYWLRGEGLASNVSAKDLVRWITIEPKEMNPLLERMSERGLVEEVQEPPPMGGYRRYALTETGIREGGRRFADEFAEITRPGHGECGDPDCECQRSGDSADCKHRTA